MTPHVLPMPPRLALWEVTGTEVFSGGAVTFFAVTEGAQALPDVGAAWRAVRPGESEPLRVHSVRNVSRIRTERDAGRLAGVVITDRVADLRPRAVTPEQLGVHA